MTEGELYRVELPFAVFGVIVRGDLIVGSAPIGNRFVGGYLGELRYWVASKGGMVLKVGR